MSPEEQAPSAEQTPPAPALQGKSIVIIGGTSGLGLSAARACARAGGRVVVVGRDAGKAEAVEGELGASCRALVGNATQPTTAVDAIDTARTAFGSFDGLYHVAGGSGRRAGDGPLHETTEAGWGFTLELNLTSVFYSNRAAAQALFESGRAGSVLNMTSVLARSPSPRYFATHAYASAKAGIIGMTRSAAAYYAPHGIRFNAVAAALVDTPMARRATGDREIARFIRTKQPLDGGRVGRPEDLDAAVVWLLSDASRFVTGQLVEIDGGWSVSEGQYSLPDTAEDSAGGEAPPKE